MAAMTIEQIIRSGDDRFALHSGYGVVEVLDVPPRQVEGLGQVVAVRPLRQDLADLLLAEQENGEVELHDEMVLTWTEIEQIELDLSVRWVHPSELIPVSSLKPEVREKLTSGKRYVAYYDNGEHMEARDEFLPGPYPVAVEVSGRPITVSRSEQVVQLYADENWLIRAYYWLMIKAMLGGPIRVKKSGRVAWMEKERRAKNGVILPGLGSTTMDDVEARIDEPVDDREDALF